MVNKCDRCGHESKDLADFSDIEIKLKDCSTELWLYTNRIRVCNDCLGKFVEMQNKFLEDDR